MDVIKEQLKRNAKNSKEFRSKVVKIMGKYYLKEVSGEEFNMKWNLAFKEPD